MARVEIYTTPSCPFCIRAKALLTEKGVDFDEIDVFTRPELRDDMTKRALGRRTVPQIFINNESIGGNSELQALENAGHLDSLLAQKPDTGAAAAR